MSFLNYSYRYETLKKARQKSMSLENKDYICLPNHAALVNKIEIGKPAGAEFVKWWIFLNEDSES